MRERDQSGQQEQQKDEAGENEKLKNVLERFTIRAASHAGWAGLDVPLGLQIAVHCSSRPSFPVCQPANPGSAEVLVRSSVARSWLFMFLSVNYTVYD